MSTAGTHKPPLSLWVRRALKARELGYTCMASIVKSYHASTYWHIVSIEYVIAYGGWPPADRQSHYFETTGHTGTIRKGTPGTCVDWKTTIPRNDPRLDAPFREA